MVEAAHYTLADDELHRPVRFTQSTEPASPAIGDQWLDPTTGILKQRNETGDGWTTVTDAQSHAPVTVSDTSSVNLSLTGQALTADAIFGTGAGQVAEGDHTHVLDNLSDVNAPTPGDGDALVYDTTTGQWINQALAAGGATTLDSLSDVAVTSPADGDGIFYDAASNTWLNGPPPSGGGGSATLLVPRWIAGRAYDQCWNVAAADPSNGTFQANTLYATPLIVPEDYTISQIEVATQNGNNAGRLARIGWYTMGADGLPASLVYGSGDLDGATAGLKTASPNLAQAAGQIFVVFVTNSTFLGFVNYQQALANVLGMDSANNIGAVPNAITAPFTYGALPATFPTTGLAYVEGCPRIALRRA